MRTTSIRFLLIKITLLFAFMLTATVVRAGPDESIKILLTVNGVAVQGSQEVVAAGLGKSIAEKRAIQDAAVLAVQRNATFQLAVTVVGPGGSSSYTGSNRLMYEHFGCLTVTSGGYVTVTPSGNCSGADVPALWIALADELGRPIAYNEYQLRVTN